MSLTSRSHHPGGNKTQRLRKPRYVQGTVLGAQPRSHSLTPKVSGTQFPLVDTWQSSPLKKAWQSSRSCFDSTFLIVGVQVLTYGQHRLLWTVLQTTANLSSWPLLGFFSQAILPVRVSRALTTSRCPLVPCPAVAMSATPPWPHSFSIAAVTNLHECDSLKMRQICCHSGGEKFQNCLYWVKSRFLQGLLPLKAVGKSLFTCLF